MIKNILIKNFKKIHTSGIVLKKLAPVNFLVGKNGSGKSSVLQAIYANFQSPSLPQLKLQNANSVIQIETKLKSKNYQVLYLNQNLPLLLNYLESQNSSANFNSLSFINQLISTYGYFDWGMANSFLEEPAGFNDSQFKVKYQLEILVKNQLKNLSPATNLILLIEEPENFLHPTWEKELPKVYQELSQQFPVQIFVATHSPFLISASGKLVQQEKYLCDCNKQEFLPTQKVFLIEKGQTASKTGKINSNSGIYKLYGSDGYWGSKVSYMAAKMLGAGLSDFLNSTQPHDTEDAPTIIFCEGEGKNEDAKIYNQIFNNLEPKVLFISSKGVTETRWSFQILEEVKNGLSGNFKLLMLRDRDHEFPTDKVRRQYLAKNLNHRILYRRAIECYLFDPEIIAKWLASLDLEMPEYFLKRLNSIQLKVEKTVQAGKQGDNYKTWFEEIFEQIYNFAMQAFNKQSVRPSLNETRVSLAYFITPETQVYNHLLEDIFGLQD